MNNLVSDYISFYFSLFTLFLFPYINRLNLLSTYILSYISTTFFFSKISATSVEHCSKPSTKNTLHKYDETNTHLFIIHGVRSLNVYIFTFFFMISCFFVDTFLVLLIANSNSLNSNNNNYNNSKRFDIDRCCIGLGSKGRIDTGYTCN